MEKIVTLLIPALLTIGLVRTLLLPIRLGFKIAVYSGCGFLCLWLLNTVSVYTGIAIPINAVTVVISGTLGLPGIAILALLAMV